MPGISGVICDLLTFYNENFEINEELNSLLIRHILTNETDSLYLFGNIGEGILFSDKFEKKVKLINLALKTQEKKNPIFVGIYGNDLEKTLVEIEDLAKKFNEINFIVSPPNLEKVPREELKSYFENFFDSIDVKNNIFLNNDPERFAGNEIFPESLKSLIPSPNLKGIIDYSQNIKNYMAFIEYLSQDFSIYCGIEEHFQKFLPLISVEKRQYSGIVSSISNLINLCSKLYYFAIKDSILELHQIQDQINDIRNKIYNIKTNEGREIYGLKYAFLYLYKDILANPVNENKLISPMDQFEIDEITKGRIQATINYLINQKQIYQLYFLGKKDSYQFKEIIKTFSNIDILLQQGKLKKIIGPYDATINTIYRVNFENNQLIFRFRTNEYFQFENIVKEKVIYPFLDGTLNPNSNNLSEIIKDILSSKMGAYMFSKENLPVIPVSNLLYYDETKDTIPYIFTVFDYIHGKSIDWYLNQFLNEEITLKKSKFYNLFKDIGESLAKLHKISFESYFENIKEIGKKRSTFLEFIMKKFDIELQEAKRNKFEFIKEIRDYLRDNEALISDIDEFVLLHNDYQCQNIIVKEESSNFQIRGIIDFDNWSIGERAKDFVKIDYFYFTRFKKYNFDDAFYEGYNKYYRIDNEFMKRIEIFKIFWLLEEYNLNFDRINKNKQINIYENDIKKILMI